MEVAGEDDHKPTKRLVTTEMLPQPLIQVVHVRRANKGHLVEHKQCEPSRVANNLIEGELLLLALQENRPVWVWEVVAFFPADGRSPDIS